MQVLDVALAEDGATVDVSKASDTDGPCPSAALLAVHHGTLWKQPQGLCVQRFITLHVASWASHISKATF